MFTKMKRDDVIALGARHRGSYLLEQFGYTIGIARLDGEALVNVMPKGYLDSVTEYADRVREAMKNKTLAAAESKGSTHDVNNAMLEAKAWRKAAVSRGKIALRAGFDVPVELTRLDRLFGVPAVVKSMHDMLKLIEANLEAFESGNLDDFLDEGKAIAGQLAQFDSEQEVRRLRSLPQTVKDFYYEKGLLYIGIKGINDWGRVLHKRDSSKANTYNLSILNRRAGKRKSNEAVPAFA